MTKDEALATLKSLPGYSELTQEELTSRYIVHGPNVSRVIYFDAEHTPEQVKLAQECMRVIYEDGVK